MVVEATLLQDYSKHKLLEYADSFRELADSFLEDNCVKETSEDAEMTSQEERQIMIWNRQLSE